MKKQKAVKLKPKKNAFRVVIWGTFCVALIITLLIPIARIGVDIYKKYQEYEELEIQLAKLQEEESILSVDVQKMQDPEYVARYLREKFMYSKEDEYVIRIPE